MKDSEFILRVPASRSPGLKGKAVRAANKENMKLNAWLTNVIENAVKESELTVSGYSDKRKDHAK